ncbi:MAG: hypothetical protein IPK50_16045 [Fibrobacterota bacterium]|nr:hypothetical protein [Fibrobacterota bacterium]QQS03797.1 MAG: hypothetical protein IPK50_16045 [Fibrobacterota bacterium]
MSLEERFLLEKQAVARVLVAFLAGDPELVQNLSILLEKELCDQVQFDHRHEDGSSLRECWKGLPSIHELVGKADSGIPQIAQIQGLADSTYAFRLLVLAHLLGGLSGKPGAQAPFEAFLSTLGLGLAEVETYRKDFVG